jgi:electron transfer flavoprotein-quinone oxidoreductase
MAALKMAREGLNVLLFERGDTPGSKNMFGGMFPRCPAIEELVPRFWDEAPWERHVVKRTLTVVSEGASTSLVFESSEFDSPPYNGCTLYRPIFDRWCAQRAQDAGVRLLTGCLVDELLSDGEAVTGVRLCGRGDEVRAPVVVVCDGVLSLLARKIGLVKMPKAADMALGVKALFSLPEEEINERFGLVRRQGAT